MKITHFFVSTATELEMANGIVSIVRPLSPHEADLREGPAYVCRSVFGDFVAFHHELDFDDQRMSDLAYARAEAASERQRAAAEGFPD